MIRVNTGIQTTALLASLATLIACLTTGIAHSANRFWIDTAGGSYSDIANWSATQGGTGGASVPLAGDEAFFTLGNTYTVHLTAVAVNNTLNVTSGNVTLDLNSNNYTVNGATGIQVGTTSSQTGRLTVRDGTLGVDTTDDLVSVGAGAGSTGFLTITTAGRLGTSTIRPSLIVGNAGTGTLALDDNARANLSSMLLGFTEDATGTTTITGPNAVVDAGGNMTVGWEGTGTVTVQTGATLNAAGTGVLGANLGALGSLTVTGGSTNWTQAGLLIVGNAGSGSVNVQSSGLATSNGAVLIGNNATGIGTGAVTGTGSIWNMASSLTVGSQGTGNLVVTSGGVLTTAGVTAIGSATGSDGFLAVNGAGSRWNASSVSIGGDGVARLVVSGAGSAELSSALTVGFGSLGSGEVTVSGTDSILNVNGPITIASSGRGTMKVDTGGTVSASGLLTIGDPAGAAAGILNFDGGRISVGGFTRAAGATLNWTDGTIQLVGGNLNNAGANLVINGSDAAAIPTLRLTSGAQSLATSVPNLTVGSSRQGAVAVIGGSNLQTTTTSIGSVDTGAGAVLVEGQGSTFSTTGDLGVGGTTVAGSGRGSLTVGVGATATVGGTLRLWSAGIVTVDGGTFAFTNLAANGGKVTFNSGRIQVLSAFNASSNTLDALLGASHILGSGRTIDSGANAFNLNADFIVDGGSIQGNTFTLTSSAIATIQNGAVTSFTGAVTNPAGGRILISNSEIKSGTTLTNNGELLLFGGLATVSATSIVNTGVISGNATINAVITNNSVGQVRVAAGERLLFGGAAGTNANNGEINVNGGSIEFTRVVTNGTVAPSTGLIVAQDATLRFNSGLSNSGALTFTAGISNVFGNVSNLNTPAAGRIVVTAGAQANFFDDVTNSGSIQVSGSGSLISTAVFLGGFSGNGVTGTGHVFLEGDIRPGFSPGTMAFGGDVSFGPGSELNIELAGLTAGSQYDRVTVAQDAALGGILNVSLLNGFTPTLGNTFQILTAAGGITGEFDTPTLPALGSGLGWDINYTATSVLLQVVTSAHAEGDFDGDGDVDGRDFLAWQRNPAVGDLADWQANYGNGSLVATSVAVPEPSALVLAMIALSLIRCSRTAR